jgi:hypothetical protein
MTDLLSFELVDSAKWEEGLSKNQDPYGFACYRYAARWANFMERDIAAGKLLADIAEATSHEADDEGITGFMYGAAVSVLSVVWKRGEELRRWHNLKTQIGKEGEKANESGSVLNPALLSIG